MQSELSYLDTPSSLLADADRLEHNLKELAALPSRVPGSGVGGE